MSRLRLTRSNLAIWVSVAVLLLLLGYENRTEYGQATRSGRPISQADDAARREPGGEPGKVAAAAGKSQAVAEPGATEVADIVAQDAEVSARLKAVGKAAIVTPARPPVIVLTVEAGQTLATLADRYTTTVETLQEMNGIIDPNYLWLGQELLAPDLYRAGDFVDWPAAPVAHARAVIGISANGQPIESFVFGDGDKHVVVVGGIHGGYEWNSVLLAYRFLDYFGRQPETVPDNIRLHIIPAGNPDGLVAVTGQVGPFAAAQVTGDTTVGRANGRGVDLNRNWGCDWSAEALWRDVTVSGGTEPFSEPETRALRDYLSQAGVEVVIWLHSAAGLVIPAGCEDAGHEPSLVAAALYGEAAGYPVGQFTAYPISGDAGNWLAQQGIASFTVELSDHQNVEMERNLQGLLSLLKGIE